MNNAGLGEVGNWRSTSLLDAKQLVYVYMWFKTEDWVATSPQIHRGKSYDGH